MNTHPQADSGSGEHRAFGESLGRAVGPVTIALRPAAPVLDRLTLNRTLNPYADTARAEVRYHETVEAARLDGGQVRALPGGGYITVKLLEYRLGAAPAG